MKNKNSSSRYRNQRLITTKRFASTLLVTAGLSFLTLAVSGAADRKSAKTKLARIAPNPTGPTQIAATPASGVLDPSPIRASLTRTDRWRPTRPAF